MFLRILPLRSTKLVCHGYDASTQFYESEHCKYEASHIETVITQRLCTWIEVRSVLSMCLKQAQRTIKAIQQVRDKVLGSAFLSIRLSTIKSVQEKNQITILSSDIKSQAWILRYCTNLLEVHLTDIWPLSFVISRNLTLSWKFQLVTLKSNFKSFPSKQKSWFENKNVPFSLLADWKKSFGELTAECVCVDLCVYRWIWIFLCLLFRRCGVRCSGRSGPCLMWVFWSRLLPWCRSGETTELISSTAN